MSSPEFRINAKITVDETSINWKSSRNTAKGRISLLDANDNVIQSFPFDVELMASALAKFAELISQEQIVKTLSETVKNDGDVEDKATNILNSIRAKHIAATKAKKSLMERPTEWKDNDDSGG